MDPPSEGVDGGSDPPSAFGLRAQQGTGDPTDDMLAMQRVEQRESGGAQPPDEGPADIYPTGSGITAPTALEPLDTTQSLHTQNIQEHCHQPWARLPPYRFPPKRKTEENFR